MNIVVDGENRENSEVRMKKLGKDWLGRSARNGKEYGIYPAAAAYCQRACSVLSDR